MGADAGFAVDGPHPELGRLDQARSTWTRLASTASLAPMVSRLDDVNTVELRFSIDLRLVARPDDIVVGDGDVFPDLVCVPADPAIDLVAAAQVFSPNAGSDQDFLRGALLALAGTILAQIQADGVPSESPGSGSRPRVSADVAEPRRHPGAICGPSSAPISSRGLPGSRECGRSCRNHRPHARCRTAPGSSVPARRLSRGVAGEYRHRTAVVGAQQDDLLLVLVPAVAARGQHCPRNIVQSLRCRWLFSIHRASSQSSSTSLPLTGPIRFRGWKSLSPGKVPLRAWIQVPERVRRLPQGRGRGWSVCAGSA